LGKPLAGGTVVGVMPAGLRAGGMAADVYLPMPLDPAKPEAVGSRSFECFGRLRPGVTIDQARAEMAVLSSEVGRQDAGEKDWGVVVESLRDYLVPHDNRMVLLRLPIDQAAAQKEDVAEAAA